MSDEKAPRFVLVPRDDNFQSLTTIGDYSIIGPFPSTGEAWEFWKANIADKTEVKFMVRALSVPRT